MKHARDDYDRIQDPITPAHYTSLHPEPIEVIEAWGLGFCDGNAVKYIARAGRKDDRLEDLRKARWYLGRLITELEKTEGPYEPGKFNCVICGRLMDESIYVTTGKGGRYAHRECYYPAGQQESGTESATRQSHARSNSEKDSE
jgi:hypothetical protein